MEEQPGARLVVRRPELAGPVERVAAALAARVDLLIDRVSDAQIASAASPSRRAASWPTSPCASSSSASRAR